MPAPTPTAPTAPIAPTAPTPTKLKKNRQDAIKTAQERTFEEDGEVAIKALRDSLGRYEAAKVKTAEEIQEWKVLDRNTYNQNNKSNLTDEQFTKGKAAELEKLNQELEIERKQNLFLKRWALLLAVGGLRFKNDNGEMEDAGKLKMPVAQIMGCGARVSIVGVDDNRVLNWLLSDKEVVIGKDLEGGTKENKSIARSEADKNSKLAHIRDAASHSFGRGKEKDKEDKLRYNIFRALSLFRGVTGNMHLGVDLAIGAYGSKDIHGRKITRDGLSGHAYLGVTAGSHNLLLGMEGCASPKSMFGTAQGQFQTHDSGAKGQTIGAFGTMSLTAQPKDNSKGYPAQLPTDKKKKYDFFKIDFSSAEAKERLDAVLKLNPNDFSDDIAGCVPVSIRKKTEVDKKLLKSYRGNLGEATMLSPKAFDAFNAFCATEHSDENTQFLMEYEKYERMRLSGNPKKEDLLKKFNEIYDKFIHEDSSSPANISSKTREDMKTTYDDINGAKPSIDILQEDVFFEPVNVVRRLLGSDTYNRFIRSAQYEEAIKPAPLKDIVSSIFGKKVLANFNPKLDSKGNQTPNPNTIYHVDTDTKYNELLAEIKKSTASSVAAPAARSLMSRMSAAPKAEILSNGQYYKDETLVLGQKNFDQDTRLAKDLLVAKGGKFYKIQQCKPKGKNAGKIKIIPVDRDFVGSKGGRKKKVEDLTSRYVDLNALRGAKYVVYNKKAVAHQNPDEVLAHLNGENGKHIIAVKTKEVKTGEFNKLEEIVKSDLKDEASQDNPLPTGFYVEIPKSTDTNSTAEFGKIEEELKKLLGTKFDRTKREIPGFLVTDKKGQSFKITRSKKGGFKVTPVEKDVSGQSRLNSSAKKVGNKKTYDSLAGLESEGYTIYKLSTDPVASNILKHLASKSLEAEGTDLEQFKKDHSSALAPRDDWQTVTMDLTQLQEAVKTKPWEHNEYYDAAYLMTNILMPKFKEFKEALYAPGADKSALEKFDSDLLGILVNWANRKGMYKIYQAYQNMQSSIKANVDKGVAENAFIKHCADVRDQNKGWGHNQAEVLVAVALQKLREAGSSIYEIKKALEGAYRKYDEANKADVAGDLVRSDAVAFISGKSVVTEKSLQSKTKEDKAAEFLNKILGKDKLFGEQKEFIEQMWGQGRFGSGISVPITNSIKDNIKSSSAFLNSMTENSDEIPFSCFIKREDVERVKLNASGVPEIDPSTQKKITEKVKKIYVVASKKMLGNTATQEDVRGICTTIVDITNLKGEHFIAGCASGEVPVRVVIEAPRENMERFGINPNDRNSAALAKDKIFTKGMADEDKQLFDNAKKDMKMVELAKYAENPSEYEKTLESSKTSSAVPSSSPSKPSAAPALPYMEGVESFRKAIKSTTERKPESGYNGMGIEIRKCDTGFQIAKIYSPESTKRIVHDDADKPVDLQVNQIITAIEVERDGKVGYYQPTEAEIIAVLRGTREANFKIGDKEYKKVGSISMVSNPDAADRGNKEYVDLAELFKTNLGLAQKAIEAIESPKTRNRSSAVIGRG